MAKDNGKPKERTEDGAEGKRRKGKVLILSSLLGVLLVAGAGGGVVMSRGMDGAMALIGLGSEAGDGVEGSVSPHGKASIEAPVFDDVMIFDDMIVNLVRVEGSTNKYARVRLAVMYNRANLGRENLDAKRQGLRETFNDYLSQLTERDLQGTYGLNVLKRELVRRARIVGGGGDAIGDVLVTDLVFQ
jgi:flagellar protein FliL